MVSLNFRRLQPRHLSAAAGLCLVLVASSAAADDLASRSFQLKYDGSGITSLRRTGDVVDTDYIAAAGALGRLIVRYRTTAHGDWKELRELLARPRGPSGQIGYALAAWLPSIASRASGSAVQGVAGIRGLNDGIVPRPPAAAGSGGRADFHLDAFSRLHPVGPVHVRRRGNDRQDRGVLDRRAAVLAAVVSRRGSVEGSSGPRSVPP
jgi:hypothetical protein